MAEDVFAVELVSHDIELVFGFGLLRRRRSTSDGRLIAMFVLTEVESVDDHDRLRNSSFTDYRSRWRRQHRFQVKAHTVSLLVLSGLNFGGKMRGIICIQLAKRSLPHTCADSMASTCKFMQENYLDITWNHPNPRSEGAFYTIFRRNIPSLK